MHDLSATMFYKAKFTIHSTAETSSDLLWRLVLEVHHWITRKLNTSKESLIIYDDLQRWSHFKFGGKFYDLQNANRIFAESVFHGNAEQPESISWACRIVEKPEADRSLAPREWVTEIGYQATSSDSAEISYVVTYSDLAGFIGFSQPAPMVSVPRVIRALLGANDLACSIGPTQLSSNAIHLSPGDFPKFQEFLLDENRQVPVIYISPKKSSLNPDGILAAIRPYRIADSVAANAIVYYATSPAFTDEMTFLGDPKYHCANGAIRVYRPGMIPSDETDGSRHPFLSAKFIDENDLGKIEELFRRALAQDTHFYENLFRMKDCKALLEADQHKERIARIYERSQGEIDEATMLLLEESDKRRSVELQCLELQEENELLKMENYDLKSKRDFYKDLAQKTGQTNGVVDAVRQISAHPDSPQAIAKYFETVYPDRLIFTERAYRSMEDCTTRSDILWEIFHCMATTLYDLLQTSPATAFTEFTNRTGWNIGRGEGTMTHADARLMQKYEDSYNGVPINIEPHIKNGVKETEPKFVRIHFAYNTSASDKIIICHCGKHIENYSSRKARR